MDSFLFIKIFILPILPPLVVAILAFAIEAGFRFIDYLKYLFPKKSKILPHAAAPLKST